MTAEGFTGGGDKVVSSQELADRRADREGQHNAAFEMKIANAEAVAQRDHLLVARQEAIAFMLENQFTFSRALQELMKNMQGTD